ncbi:MAG: hypothetical protein RLP44_04930 [Aggregatilineales bacterium]
MSKKRPSNLLDKHIANLKSVCPNADVVFVCPICFSIFTYEEAQNPANVNLGHIWPKYIRNTTEDESVKHQQVLLCTCCNSQAGSIGDNQMQEFEITRQGEKEGKPSRKRKMSFISRNRQESFSIYDYFNKEDGKSGSITFEGTPDKFKYNKDYRRIDELITNQEHFDLIVYPHEASWDLAQVGWLTSAYLFAFYTFGYRYIFHNSLDKVRNYILRSFEGETKYDLEPNPLKNVCVSICNVHYEETPNILYILPKQGTDQIHFLEINFLDRHIRLPGREHYIFILESDDPEIFVGMSVENGLVANSELNQWDYLFYYTHYCVNSEELTVIPDE